MRGQSSQPLMQIWLYSQLEGQCQTRTHLFFIEIDVDLHEGSGDLGPVALICAQRLIVDGRLQLREVLQSLL